jgi:hypothetical protein
MGVVMTRKLGQHYRGEGPCGLRALRQITTANDNDIMSACLFHGYDPKVGGMDGYNWKLAANKLGVKLSTPIFLNGALSLAEVSRHSREEGSTLVVGLATHMLVIRAGKILDEANSPPDRRVYIVIPVLNDPYAEAA